MIVERKAGRITHDHFSNLPKYLSGYPLMVFNDTRVSPVRLTGHHKRSSRQLEVLLVKEQSEGEWEALIKGLNKLNPGDEISFDSGQLTGVFLRKIDDRALLKLGPDISSLLDRIARMPLPPYIKRDDPDDVPLEKLDRERYQTVYARNAGAIAAPTAGLHFTDRMLDKLQSGPAEAVFLTLHVGPGTFKPVRSDDITLHQMESEYYHVQEQTLKRLFDAQRQGRKILAVGSTATRVLESLEFEKLPEGDVEGWTNKFIYPGYEFRKVSELLTNFHLPKSTLFILVCTFGGMDLMKQAYKEAIREEYRFFSYGDAMLIL